MSHKLTEIVVSVLNSAEQSNYYWRYLDENTKLAIETELYRKLGDHFDTEMLRNYLRGVEIGSASALDRANVLK